MSGPTSPPPIVTVEQVSRAQERARAAAARWEEVGRLGVTVREVAEAELLVHQLAERWQPVEAAALPLDRLPQAEEDVRSAGRRLRRVARGLARARLRLAYLGYCQWLRRVLVLPDRQLWAICLVNGIAGALAAALVTVIFRLGMAEFAALGALGYLLVAAAGWPMLARATTEGLEPMANGTRERVAERTAERDALRAELRRLTEFRDGLRAADAVRRDLAAARERLEHLRANHERQAEYEEAAREARLLQNTVDREQTVLLSADWRALRGAGFEEFLARVFLQLGYEVRPAPPLTASRGPDLILARDGRRVAVRVRGEAGRVGIEAVQEAHAGKASHDCQACLVVTGGRFTLPALELAEHLGCLTVDGARVPALVRGLIL